MKTFSKILALFVFLSVATPIFAQDSTNGATPTPREKLEQINKERQEAAKARMEEKLRSRSSATGTRPVNKERVQEKRQELKDKMEAKREELKEKREEKIAEIKEKTSERMANSFEKIYDGFSSAASRLAEHADKIAERISKFEASGKDLTVAKAKLEIANGLITALPASIEASQTAVTTFLGGDLKINRPEIRKEVEKVKGLLKAAHASLVEVLRAIKSVEIKTETNTETSN